MKNRRFFVLVFLLFLVPSFTVSSQSPPNLKLQLRHLKKSLVNLKDLRSLSVTHSQWEEGHHKLLQSLQTQSLSWCLIDFLSMAELVEIEDDLLKLDLKSTRENAACKKNIDARLENYWELQRSQFLSFNTITNIAIPSQVKKLDVSSGPILVRGDLKDGEVALTFDDGPHPHESLKILEILSSRGVLATYFALGQNAKRFPQITQTITGHGHTVASHSETHPSLPKMNFENAKLEIQDGVRSVAEVIGVRVPFFRFPYGAISPELKNYVKDTPLASFLWNMDSEDWKYKDLGQLWQNIISELDREKGGIILFHDIHRQTREILPLFLEELHRRKMNTIYFQAMPFSDD